MKKSTHPQISQTLIYFKDGSAYMKRWLYFRNSLTLESDTSSHTFWKKSNLINSSASTIALTNQVKQIKNKK